MGITLQVAGEKRAYTLSDLGTFLAFRARIGLEALSKQEASLRNEYSLLRPDPARLPAGRAPATAAADRFEAFLLDPATRARIAAFGADRFGQALFAPLTPATAGASGPGS